MPRPSRICSTIDCGRVHHAQGYARKANKKVWSASRPPETPQKVAS